MSQNTLNIRNLTNLLYTCFNCEAFSFVAASWKCNSSFCTGLLEGGGWRFRYEKPFQMKKKQKKTDKHARNFQSQLPIKRQYNIETLKHRRAYMHTFVSIVSAVGEQNAKREPQIFPENMQTTEFTTIPPFNRIMLCKFPTSLEL